MDLYLNRFVALWEFTSLFNILFAFFPFDSRYKMANSTTCFWFLFPRKNAWCKFPPFNWLHFYLFFQIYYFSMFTTEMIKKINQTWQSSLMRWLKLNAKNLCEGIPFGGTCVQIHLDLVFHSTKTFLSRLFPLVISFVK